MSDEGEQPNRRIVVIDDNPAIHKDFRKILCPDRGDDYGIVQLEAAVFGHSPDRVESAGAPADYEIESAMQGESGLELVRRALTEKRPYAVAFIDVRMPPGWDGIETIARIWQLDPDIQTVICTAHSDYSWDQILKKLGHSDRLFILKKPFDIIEVQQLADTLTRKWDQAQGAQQRLATLEQLISERTGELRDSDARLRAVNQQIITAAAPRRHDVMSTQLRVRHILADELRNALEAGELSVHYQPLIDISTRRIVSLEALVRWHHPRDGAISPAIFIPVAEESGLILPLGEFVLKAVCEQVVRWEQEGVPVVRVAVNVSAVQLARQNLRTLVRGLLRETGMQPQYLALEITESSLIKDGNNRVDDLQGLRRDGVHIMMDDFGTGYSSLSYLKNLPIDTLKIDRSFICHLDTDLTDETILSAILVMARSLGLTVVAEGVETAAQLAVLRKHGCEVAQGYFFSRPLPVDRCGSMLLALADRSSFTDTLRLKIAADEPDSTIFAVERK